AFIRFTRRVTSFTRFSRSRLGRLASSSAVLGTAAMLQCFGSPPSQPRKTRLRRLVGRPETVATARVADIAKTPLSGFFRHVAHALPEHGGEADLGHAFE